MNKKLSEQCDSSMRRWFRLVRALEVLGFEKVRPPKEGLLPEQMKEARAAMNAFCEDVSKDTESSN